MTVPSRRACAIASTASLSHLSPSRPDLEPNMVLFVLAYLGGVLTIVSPCILPVLPFVFARADRPFVKSGLPMLIGMAVTFGAVRPYAVLAAAWAVMATKQGPK